MARAIICLGLAAVALTPGAASISAQDPAKAGTQPLWAEERWPFPIDQWGTGQAFGCAAERCGRQLHLYLRAKIGFCRCATGVSDDDEIERVGDLRTDRAGLPSVGVRSHGQRRNNDRSCAPLCSGAAVAIGASCFDDRPGEQMRCDRRNGDHGTRRAIRCGSQGPRLPAQRRRPALGRRAGWWIAVKSARRERTGQRASTSTSPSTPVITLKSR